GRAVPGIRGDLEASALDPAATVVVLDAPVLADAELEALNGFVRHGGHLVVGGTGAEKVLEKVVDEPPLLAVEEGVRNASPVGPATAEVEGVRNVRAGRLGSWKVPGGLQ